MKITESSLWQIGSDLGAISGMEYCTIAPVPRPPKKDMRAFEKAIGRALSPQMASFYNELTTVSIWWEYRTNPYDLAVVGKGTLMGLDTFVHGPRLKSSKAAVPGKKYEGYLWQEGDDPAWIRMIEDEFFVLDFIDELSNTYVLFRFVKEVVEPELFLCKYPHFLYPLRLSFAEYIENSVAFREIFCWQDYFIDRARTDAKSLQHLDAERPDLCLENVKIVNPNIDLSQIALISNMKAHSFGQLGKQKDYSRRFSKKLGELEAIIGGKGEFEFEASRQPLTILTIRKIETVLGHSLPDSMLVFYSQLNGFKLNWQCERVDLFGENPPIWPKGYLEFLKLEQVFGGMDPLVRTWHDQMFEGIITMEDSMLNDELAFARECRPICIEPGTTTVIRFVVGQDEPELYVMEQGTFTALPLSFSEFVERLLENMGIEYWQWFFTNRDDFPDEHLATCPPVPKFVQILFPETDVTGYRNVRSNLENGDRP